MLKWLAAAAKQQPAARAVAAVDAVPAAAAAAAAPAAVVVDAAVAAAAEEEQRHCASAVGLAGREEAAAAEAGTDGVLAGAGGGCGADAAAASAGEEEGGDVARSAAEEGSPLAGTGGTWARGPSRQLLTMVAGAARRWLPALSRLVAAPGGELRAGLAGGCEPAGMAAAGQVLRWVPVLVHAASQQEALLGRSGAEAAPPEGPGMRHQREGGRGPEERGGAVQLAAPVSGQCGSGGVDQGWRLLLLEEVGVVELLGCTLRGLRVGAGAEAGAGGGSPAPPYEAERLHEACVALECVAVAFPREVAAALAEGRLPPLHRAPEALLGGAAAAQLPLEQRRQRERLLALLSAIEGDAVGVGAGASPAATAAVAGPLLPDPCVGGGSAPASAVAALLLAAEAAPGERGAMLLPACSNPLCANLAGDSEADLPLRACGGCGRARYCCAGCQREHWRAGHRAECTVRPSSGGGGASIASVG
ncbi:hypothetical protein TSOC_009954 [Tetrabaena socialis]|uniref:phytol kinase n=1 Tax=Tetrabaena socialis TaxID=47790 RepID=A0A2J7ZUK8_9CHLO|nr:hypothetical protein TSOC_009954 [Tetrabaena socialis]|eukprot:PNH03920.1 hypothetical protein TSOC_009954 [Tetrabaena socialis]